MQISNGKKQRARRYVIYGPEGIGKTTLAMKFPEALNIDLEAGTDEMEVARVEDVGSWSDLMSALNEVAKDASLCKTLVIDTADKAEAMAADAVCAENNWKSVEDPGYGKGRALVSVKIASLLSGMDYLIKKGINVVFVAHAQMRKFEQPDELGAYDRWELKLLPKNAALLKEWADAVLFCNYKTKTLTANGKTKARGSERVIYTDHNACWDAKNRLGMPEEMPMDYEELKGFVEA